MTRIVCGRGVWPWVALVTAVSLLVHMRGPLPPHSSHDAFLVIPQLLHAMSGAVPDDPLFGMFHSTWFSEHAIAHGAQGGDAVMQRAFGNVQEHTWIDAPHPMLAMALVHHLVPLGPVVPLLVQCGFFAVLLFALAAIGRAVGSEQTGRLAALLAVGTPGLFGAIHYIEPHLAIAAVSTACVAMLLKTDRLRDWRWAVAASLALWSLGRSGEGSGEAVIAGLVVVGPVLWTVAASDRSLSVRRWLVGLSALAVPFLVLSDLPWMMAAMERVTRAFADPAVQSDVVAKGGALSSPVAWMGAYLILAVTDYFRPLLAALVAIGLMGAIRSDVRRRGIVLLWLLVPWFALSWMQRKASWYGIALLPPVLLWAAVGLERLLPKRAMRVAGAVAVAQLLVFSLVSAERYPGALSLLRDPLPLHDWRLRRIEFLQPGVSEANGRAAASVDRIVDWMEAAGEERPVAIMTMGTQHDYAVRYALQLNMPGVEVINVGDPRVRELRYRSLHPNDFGVFAFFDSAAVEWPPSASQSVWLSGNLHCSNNDPFDSFVAAVFARSGDPVDGFYPLEKTASERLGPGQVWKGRTVNGGLCAQ